MPDLIYLDNSATTRPYAEVLDYMNKVSYEEFGNPSSLHKLGIRAEKLVELAREHIARSLKADTNEIIFTSGGTESNNMAIRGFVNANYRNGRHVITTKIEHPSVTEVFKSLTGEGYDTDYIGVDKYGVLDCEELKSKIRSDTILVSLIYVNNETGVIQPLEKLIGIIKNINRDIAIHVDAVQAYGKIPVFPASACIDLMSLSAHKIHGPKGCGALYIKKGTRINPVVYGGGQEWNMRSGTENVSAICGFGKAVEMIFHNLNDNYERVNGLRELFLAHLKKEMDGRYQINSPADGIPYILNVAFDRVKAEVLLHHLEANEIFISTGSACSSRKNTRSHVLKAMGIDPRLIDGSVRFSFSGANTENDIIKAIEEMRKIIDVIKY